ncbi:hypothetical protein PUR71_31505 [Streptomyces sp. SP17BM10]|uniref:hypothetical protein n=1 Tax=Streptomyces sp. SP17BM10 TaxID=3002530 RepID=UPI002E7A5469|nr:hypothetical protein [Streptomyces sp. SP17BM10]MEE1787396.1 hypothetical protein [Streptomyces sp. SP17BM10]
MLSTRNTARRRAALVPVSAALLLMSAAVPAIADETPGGGAQQCAPNVICGDIHGGGGTSTGGGGTGGGGGGGSSGDGPLLCGYHGQEWPCHDPEMGWFSNSDGCYYTTVDKPADDPAWEGHKPSEGSLYLPSCPQAGGGFSPGAIRFSASAPAAPPPDPRALALEILKDKMAFPAPAPTARPLGTAVVKSPVWLWVNGHQAPQPVSLTLRGVTVTVTPRLKNVVWNFGDKLSLTCDKPGTPYEDGYGGAKSPDCGYEFATGSAGEPGGAFTVSATANWVGAVTVTGLNTRNFEIPMPQTATFQLKVAEVQVLN